MRLKNYLNENFADFTRATQHSLFNKSSEINIKKRTPEKMDKNKQKFFAAVAKKINNDYLTQTEMDIIDLMYSNNKSVKETVKKLKK